MRERERERLLKRQNKFTRESEKRHKRKRERGIERPRDRYSILNQKDKRERKRTLVIIKHLLLISSSQ